MYVVIAEPHIGRYESVISSRIGGNARVVTVGPAGLKNLEDPHKVSVYVGSSFSGDEARLMPNLRLIHCAGAGTDGVDWSAVPTGVPVANTYHHERSIAEYVLMALIIISRNILDNQAAFVEGRWPISTELWDTLRGRTVGLVGFGHIGREVAKLCRPFVREIIAVRRTPMRESVSRELVDAEVDAGGLLEVARTCDALVISVPLTESTEGLVDSALLRSMKAEAILVNVSRGPVVSEEALYRALREGWISGAALDVWYQYPADRTKPMAPSKFPFHRLSNVLMTPHIAGMTEETFRKRAGEIGQNIERVRCGEEPENLC